MNSSFSPPPSRIWDCRLQLDSVPRQKGHRDRTGNDVFTSHQHSVSDGALSYPGSLSDGVHASRRWTSPVQKSKVNDVAASMVGGSRLETSPYPLSYAAKASALSSSSESPSWLSELGHWESSTSRHPYSAPSRHFSRRSHMSKAVYPLMFHNPVSDIDIDGIGRLTPSEEQASPPFWHEVRPEFHQRDEVSPDVSASSRREGNRWSSASSYDMGFENDKFDIMVDELDIETPMSPSIDQKCGVCSKPLHQKSPWCSHRIVRSNDMPVAGVLPCRHVFHADCLEHMTPKTQMHEPPCPMCLKGLESASSFSEPLQMALRSLRGQRVVISETLCGEGGSRKGKKIGPSSIKNQLKRHLSYLRKGKKAIEA